MEAKYLMLGNLVLYSGYTVVVQSIRGDKVGVAPLEKSGKPSKNTGRFVEPAALSGISINGVILEQMGFVCSGVNADHTDGIYAYEEKLEIAIDAEGKIFASFFAGDDILLEKTEAHYLQNMALFNCGVALEIVKL